ncbi:MAG: uroporphyrinogen-III C-methyltransferase, partial [Alicyclobacillus sp.]|nr:uroporphyrinogen-III C-methyltransferase [Alicyclobacillus sp.]
YLVGAGPGDPGLLTVRGKRLLASADAVVFDRLLSPRLLLSTPDHCELYSVGKAAGRHPVPQAEIEALLLRLARAGKRVVRLKGGDPFVFGRGGEEALALAAAGVPWEVVPGVTSAVAAPAYAGIPVTHRGVSAGFTVWTGHQRATVFAPDTADGGHGGASMAGKGDPRADASKQPLAAPAWSAPARGWAVGPAGTLLILMGVERLATWMEQLAAAGYPPETPVALVRWGSRAAQHTLTATVATAVQAAQQAAFTGPAVIVVGAVAQLRTALQWAEHRPLFGKRVAVVGRDNKETEAYADELAEWGAEVYDFPLSAVLPTALPQRLQVLSDAIRDALEGAPWDAVWVLAASAWPAWQAWAPALAAGWQSAAVWAVRPQALPLYPPPGRPLYVAADAEELAALLAGPTAVRGWPR